MAKSILQVAIKYAYSLFGKTTFEKNKNKQIIRENDKTKINKSFKRILFLNIGHVICCIKEVQQYTDI